MTKRGHRAEFYPKFHCELNFIEKAWLDLFQEQVKSPLRLHICFIDGERPESVEGDVCEFLRCVRPVLLPLRSCVRQGEWQLPDLCSSSFRSQEIHFASAGSSFGADGRASQGEPGLKFVGHVLTSFLLVGNLNINTHTASPTLLFRVDFTHFGSLVSCGLVLRVEIAVFALLGIKR